MTETVIELQTPSFADPSLPLAVVVAATRWDEPPRMRHQITRQLMRWFNVLFVEFFPDPRHREQTGFVQHDDRLISYASTPHSSLPVRLYANDPFTHGFVNRRFARDIVCAVSFFGKHIRPLLFNFIYDFHEIMGQLPFIYSSYFCFDEFPKMWRQANQPNALKYLYQSRLYQHYENKVVKHADLCLATHTPLKDKLSMINDKTILFMHGHEFKVQINKAHARHNGKRIRAAYMGYITYNLLVDWLQMVLDSPDVDVYLIGPLGKFDIKQFSNHPHFHHIKTLTGNSLHSVLADMDVLVMPYNPVIPEVNVQTVSNKFFQYVAAGRPVVISDMQYYIDMPPGVIYRAKTAEEFVIQIRRAHAEDCQEFRELRAQIARENTWDKRGEMLLSIIRQDMEGSDRAM